MMYLILSDIDGNATPEVFHHGVDLIELRPPEKRRAVGEDRRRRSVGEYLTKKIL